MDHRIARIKEKVKNSGIQLNPPISSIELEAFEQKHKVTLPEGFRRFMLEVGNGGEGPPAFGLVALGDTAHLHGDRKAIYSELATINRPFPFSKDMWWEDGGDSDDARQWNVYDGNLYLGTDGCSSFWQLIVTGSERENMWLFLDVGIVPMKRDFLQWYEAWLDGEDLLTEVP